MSKKSNLMVRPAPRGDRAEMVRSLADEAMECSRLYGLLARVFRCEPTLELLEIVRSSSFQDALGASATALSESLLKRSQEEVIHELSVEFTRLFLGPGRHISPHESVQLDGGNGPLWGEATVAVQRFIEKAGFKLSEHAIHPPDHISVALDFLSHLARLESESWSKKDLQAVENTLNWQASFYSQHIGKWFSLFCHTILENQPVAFYRTFSEILSQFLTQEQKSIGHRRSTLQLLKA